MLESITTPPVQLASPTETLNFESNNEGFFSQKRIVAGVAKAGIWGARFSEYRDFKSNTGLFLYGEKLHRAAPQELEKLGLWVASVSVYGLAKLDNPAQCNLFIPDEEKTVLEADFTYEEDYLAGSDPIARYLAYTTDWRIKKTGEEVLLFIPASPNSLSRLSFSLENAQVSESIESNPDRILEMTTEDVEIMLKFYRNGRLPTKLHPSDALKRVLNESSETLDETIGKLVEDTVGEMAKAELEGTDLVLLKSIVLYYLEEKPTDVVAHTLGYSREHFTKYYRKRALDLFSQFLAGKHEPRKNWVAELNLDRRI